MGEHSINTTFVRREIRRSMEQGFLRIPEGEALHRSDASRQLFERATRTAIQNKGVVDAPILLRTLLARPTQAMLRVLGKTVDVEQEPEEAPGSANISQNKFAQEIPVLTGEQAQAFPAVIQPQVQVLSWALRRASAKPICLICAGKVDITGLLQRSAQKEQPSIRIIQVNTADLLKGARNSGSVLDRVGEIFTGVGKPTSAFVFFDTTSLKIEKVALLLKSLKPFIEAPNVRLIFAVQVGQFNQIIDELQMDGLFQEIWLHELKELRLPHQL